MPFVSTHATRPVEAGFADFATTFKSPQTFDDGMALALELHFALKSSAGKDQVRIYHKHLGNTIGNLPLGDISPLILERLRAYLVKKGNSKTGKPYKTQTIKHIFGIVRQVYSLLIGLGLFNGPNPALGLKFPKLNNRRVRFLTIEEVILLFGKLKERSTSVWRMSFLSLCTGMREGEIFSLKGEHIDLRAKKIVVADPKNGESRVVPLNNVAVALLRQCHVVQGELVFPSSTGGVRTKMSRTFARTVEALGFNRGIEDARQRVVFHSLRHTFASWMAQNKIPTIVLAKLLGHKTLDMAQWYAHLNDECQMEAVSVIDGIISPDKLLRMVA